MTIGKAMPDNFTDFQTGNISKYAMTLPELESFTEECFVFCGVFDVDIVLTQLSVKY